MIKSISLAYRKPGMTREEFSRYWREQHASLAANMIPGLRKYVQNHFITVPGREYEGDGIVEMWYDDVEAFEKSLAYLQTDAGRKLAADGEKFSEMRRGFLWVVEEHVIKGNIEHTG
jgi:uncharacterized protein (TIGR02118 family)